MKTPSTIKQATEANLGATGGRNERLEYQPFLKAWVPAYSGNRFRTVKRKQLSAYRHGQLNPVGKLLPNNVGNYLGKRPPNPELRALTCEERLEVLQLTFGKGPSARLGENPYPTRTFGRRKRPAGHPKKSDGVMRASRKVSTFRIGAPKLTAA